VAVLTSFAQAFHDGLCNIHVMGAPRIVGNIIFAIGIVIAAILGLLLFQGEVLIAIFLGVPSIIVLGGLVWLTHILFAEAKPRY
jgi:hypothetical protein